MEEGMDGTTTIQSNYLSELAARIRAEHEATSKALKSAVEHAMRVPAATLAKLRPPSGCSRREIGNGCRFDVAGRSRACSLGVLGLFLCHAPMASTRWGGSGVPEFCARRWRSAIDIGSFLVQRKGHLLVGSSYERVGSGDREARTLIATPNREAKP
jgi:hypothetical protein